MRIKMRATKAGSEDGFSSRIFAEGEIYEVAELLALSFIAGGDAEPAEAAPVAAVAPKGRARK
jgi:hypothetical protein